MRSDDLVADIRASAVREGSTIDWTGTSEVVGRAGSADLATERLEGLEWTRSLIGPSRLTASVFEGCTFDHVVFDECDLSGATFIDCVFRECVIEGGKSSSLLAFVDCSLQGLAISGLSADLLEVQGCRVAELVINDGTIDRLRFMQTTKLSRRTAWVSIVGCVIAAVGGISDLAAAGISVQVDRELWTLLGDLLLKQMGVESVSAADVAVERQRS